MALKCNFKIFFKHFAFCCLPQNVFLELFMRLFEFYPLPFLSSSRPTTKPSSYLLATSGVSSLDQGMNRSTFFDRSDPVPVPIANSVPFLVPFHQSQLQFQFQFQFRQKTPTYCKLLNGFLIMFLN